jgi:PIN domain nuclease of toxin-antitoxin system
MAFGRRTEELKLLDTHVWVWAVENDPLLKLKHIEILEQNPDSLVISAVSLWEVSMLVAKGRMRTRYPLKEWFDFATSTFGIAILPLPPDVAQEAYELPGKFHEDPADRLIVATARIHNCLLLTEDSKIKKYPHVKVG